MEYIRKSRESKLLIERSKSFRKGRSVLKKYKLTIRLLSPVKRDAYAEVLSKHYELVKRGEIPGSGHFIERRAADSSSNSAPDSKGILFGDTPTVSPAVAVDEDGKDISIVSNTNHLIL